MALKHAKTSLKSDGADATLIQPSDWNGDHVIDADGATMTTRTDNPAAPAAGKMILFGKTVGGGALPGFIGPSGISSPLQPFIGRNKVGVWMPYGNNTTTSNLGLNTTITGTSATRIVAATNLFTSMRRLGLTTATSANARATVSAFPQFFLSSQPGVGGFRFVARLGISDAAVAAGTLFAGFAAASSIGTANPSASTNIIGVGADGTDTTLQMMSNDSSGVATKIDLGASFPANTTNTDMYEIALFAPSGGGPLVNWQVTNLSTGATASGAITTDLPAVDPTSNLLLPVVARGNLSTGAAVGIDIAGIYLETDN